MINLNQAKSAVRLFMTHPDYLLRVVYENCKPALSYYLSRNGFSSYPTTLILFLTHQCNMRCKMCGLWGTSGTAHDAPPGESPMTAADFAEVVHQVAFCKPTITLFGGEPLVFKGWDTVAQHAKAANLRCRIVTNGLLVEKYASRIVELGIDKVNVSIDGPAPINDEVRGVKGGYEKAIKGIHAVNAVKKARGVNLPLMSIVCTISQDNHAYLVDLAEGVKELPLSSLVYQHLTFITKERYEEHNRIFSKHLQKASEVCKGFVLNHENLDPQVLVSQLHRLSHSEYRFPVLFRPGFSPREVVEYYTNPSYERGSHQVCVAPWREAYVMPDGSLTPCLDYVVGNVRETPFRKLWNNTAFCRFRAAVKKHGRFPFCHKCCN